MVYPHHHPEDRPGAAVEGPIDVDDDEGDDIPSHGLDPQRCLRALITA